MLELWAHNTFKEKNTNNEWFELDSKDYYKLCEKIESALKDRSVYNNIEKFVHDNCDIWEYGQIYNNIREEDYAEFYN